LVSFVYVGSIWNARNHEYHQAVNAHQVIGLKSLQSPEITISMDAKGRWLDNVEIERFGRSRKFENI
jgi:hypothetical protein